MGGRSRDGEKAPEEVWEVCMSMDCLMTVIHATAYCSLAFDGCGNPHALLPRTNWERTSRSHSPSART